MKTTRFSEVVGVGFIAVLPLVASWGTDGQIVVTAEVPVHEVTTSVIDGCDVITLPEGIYTSEVGAPMLPVRPLKVVMPFDARFDSVTILADHTTVLAEGLNIVPAQAPRPLSMDLKDTAPIALDERIYESTSSYPGKLTRYSEEGSLAGYRLVTLDLCPVQYVPACGRATLHDEITLVVHYSKSTEPFPVLRRSTGAQRLYERVMKALVVNPEDVGRFAPPVETIDRDGRSSTHEGFEYLIVTDSSMREEFEELAEWKTKKGVPAVVRTTEWIDGRYPGRDRQERIRYYLKVAHQDSGLVWVLLGGDRDAIPIRDVWFWDPDVTDPPYFDTLPSDHYFACLDGDWDADGDGVFGEHSDNVDFLPELFVGRALVGLDDEVDDCFTNKVLTYEQNPPADYLLDALFLASWGGAGIKESVASDVANSFEVWKWYEEGGGNITLTEAGELYDHGVNIANHWGGGRFNALYLRARPHYCAELHPCPRNAPRYMGLFFTVSTVGGFDQHECWAREYCTCDSGGGFLIANTRYGWGGTEEFDRQVFRQLFSGGFYNVGACLAVAKSACGTPSNTFKWTQYCLTLFGDPETPIWTYDTLTLSVEHIVEWEGAEAICTVTVGYRDIPLGGARVCLSNPEYYQIGYTDQNGEAVFRISLTETSVLSLVVTYGNAPYPYQGQIEIVGVEEAPRTECPGRLRLACQPNPFQRGASIGYHLPERGQVGLRIYDGAGQLVRTLVLKEQSTGFYEVRWNGRDSSGRQSASGVYFCRIELHGEAVTDRRRGRDYTLTRKMVLVK